MNTKALLICAFLFIAAAHEASAATAATVAPTSQTAPSGPDARVDAFFRTLKGGKAAQAYNEAFAGTLMTKKQAELENMIAQTENLFRYYGTIIDWEMVKENRVSEKYLVRTYLLRTGEMPVFFTFQLYDNGRTWMVANIFLTDTYSNSGL